MINLPEWKLTLCEPLYDTSSKSPIEMTAQVYGKMRELVTAFNEFTVSMNKAFEDFTNGTIKDVEEFKNSINCIMLEYMNSIDTKINEHNADFEEFAKKYINEQLIKYNETAEEVIIGGATE